MSYGPHWRPLVLALAATLVLVPLLGLAAPGATSQAQTTAPSIVGLRVVGNQVVNGAGQPVRLLGVNRSSAQYGCVEGWGFFDGPTDQAAVTAMLGWKINAVRLPLNEQCWLGINGMPAAYSGANYVNAVRTYVNLLNSNGIAVILDLHWNAPGTQKATGQQDMADRDHAVAFWQSVASTFKGNSAVLFDLYNEPHPDSNRSTAAAWTCWRDGGTCPGGTFTAAGMQELVTAVRGTGATNIIVLSGIRYGSQLDSWLQYKPVDPLNQLAAGFHSYGDGLDCQNLTCWNSVLAGVTAQVPLIATEIGQFDCSHSYIDPLMSWFDASGQHYTAWSWGAYDCAGDPALLADWSGTPTQTFGVGYKTRLLQVAGTLPATATSTAVVLPSPGATSTALATATATRTATPPASPTLAPSPTATGTATPTLVPSPTRTPTPVLSPTASPTVVPSPTRTPTLLPSPTTSPTAGTGPRVLYDWESGTTLSWAADWGTVSGVAATTAQHYGAGTGALTFQGTLRGKGWQDLGVTRYYLSGSTQNFSGGTNTLSGWVYLPAGSPTTIQANLGLFDPSYTFRTSPNVMLVPGQWTQITWPNAPLASVNGVTLTLGANNPNWTGTVYLDYVTVR